MHSFSALSSRISGGNIHRIWAHWPHLCLPELIAVLQGLIYGNSLLEAYSLALFIRLAWVMAEVIHGTGHTVTRALVDCAPKVICLENLLEHRSVRQLLQTLLPLAPIGLAGTGPLPSAWLQGGDPAPWKLRLKASGGILLHLVVIAGASMAIQAWQSSSSAMPWMNELLMTLMFSNICLALASWTDMRMVFSGRGSLLHCGNFGLVAAPEVLSRRELLSSQVIDIVQRMGRETELRGAQAGGGLVLTLDRQGDVRFVGHRIVNAKRGDLTTALEAGFRKQRRRASRRGFRPHPSGLMACWHYRFGTSAPPPCERPTGRNGLPAGVAVSGISRTTAAGRAPGHGCTTASHTMETSKDSKPSVPSSTLLPPLGPGWSRLCSNPLQPGLILPGSPE